MIGSATVVAVALLFPCHFFMLLGIHLLLLFNSPPRFFLTLTCGMTSHYIIIESGGIQYVLRMSLINSNWQQWLCLYGHLLCVYASIYWHTPVLRGTESGPGCHSLKLRAPSCQKHRTLYKRRNDNKNSNHLVSISVFSVHRAPS